MTRKDYELIAGAMRAANVYFSSAMMPSADESEMKRAAINYAANQLADRLAEDNPRFDRARFIEACKGA
jgi:hypothetical protein